MDYTAKAWLPARDIVLAAVENRKQVHPSGKVLVFDSFSPWKVGPVCLRFVLFFTTKPLPLSSPPQEHLHILETELAIPEAELPLYVLYAEGDPTGKWRVQAVPKSAESFESRKALPEA